MKFFKEIKETPIQTKILIIVVIIVVILYGFIIE